MNIQELISKSSIKVITPESKNYDESRSLYNGMIDKRPAAIAVCKTESDVIKAIKFASKNNMETSVRSGGHNGAGLALVNDGLVIDLSEMNAITVDPATKTAIIQSMLTEGC